MNLYEEAAAKHKQMYRRNLINNLINSIDSLITGKSTPTIVKFLYTGFGLLVVAITAGARCRNVGAEEIQTQVV